MKEISRLLKKSQYKRIIFLFCFVSTLLLIGVSVELGVSYFYEIRRARLDADNLNQAFGTQIESTFKKVDMVLLNTIELLKSRNSIEDWKTEELSKILVEKNRFIPEAQNVFVVGKDGRDKVRFKLNSKFNLGDRDYFYKQFSSVENKLVFSKPLVSRETGRLVIILSRKILDKNNQFAGIVAAGVPLIYFSNFYSELNLLPDSAITINGIDNLLYSRYPWVEKFIGFPLQNQDTIRELFYHNKRAVFAERKSRIDGVTRITSARRVGDYDFFVVTALSKSQYMTGWYTKCAIYIISFIVLFIFALNFLTRSLKALNDLEEQRKVAVQNAKLTSLGEMAGGIAHEINNPLAIISGRVNLMIKSIDSNQYDPEGFKTSLDKIGQTTERIAKIVRSLKAFSRTNEQDPFIPTQVKDVIEHTIEICREKFRTSPVSLKIDSIPDVQINCRESQIVQVVLNLLSNAFDAVEKLDEKWIEVKFEVIGSEKILIKVIDSGMGIPDSVANNIMQPFFTTKEVGKGTGLGLSISKGIIEDHNGKIYLDKEVSNTCFVIEMGIV
nr:ATP-binding protein [Bacteriovorax sp. HI3]